MQFDFSKPQRQSSSGIVIMASYAIFRVLRAVIFPLVIFIVKAQFDIILYILIAAAVIIVISLVYSYYYFIKFTFYLDDEKQEFVINKGVFGRTMLTFPLEKIQQVNINQSLLQKMVGVYSVHLDTAGTDTKEASIKAVTAEVAYGLKAHLLNGKAESITVAPSPLPTPIAVNPPTVTPSTIFKVSPLTLLKVGLTSNYGSSFALLVGFAYAVFHNIKEFLKIFYTDNGQVEDFISQGLSLASIGILTIALLVVLLVINVIRTFVRYFNFQVSSHQQSLLISAGLFTKKDTLLHPKKVQLTTYSQNYIQKKLNLFNLILKQAHTGEQQDEKEIKTNNLEVPGCHSEEKNLLLTMILGKLPVSGQTFYPNWRFINLPVFFQAVLPFIAFLAAYFFLPEVVPYLPLAIAYLLIVVAMVYISFTKHQIKVSDDYIVKRSGIWDISHDIVEPHKIQAITTFQYPWHKSVDVGHVDLHTAAGVVRFKFGNYTKIKQLVNFWLYQVESGHKDWM